eukprot:scaffold59385_cov39-Prasinocladus_malaysianus.AAC.1
MNGAERIMGNRDGMWTLPQKDENVGQEQDRGHHFIAPSRVKRGAHRLADSNKGSVKFFDKVVLTLKK